jgi:hypothetical protein
LILAINLRPRGWSYGHTIGSSFSSMMACQLRHALRLAAGKVTFVASSAPLVPARLSGSDPSEVPSVGVRSPGSSPASAFMVSGPFEPVGALARFDASAAKHAPTVLPSIPKKPQQSDVATNRPTFLM